ncbi:Calcium-dependent protein kinase 2 [Seminavis robusta]|uniref:Calcium-dependent protein kinase 2 n=1 Tax=Seminavis robusta TaxID=568900 RepID=A0A9N8DFU5_9STRA|nr:Calcium-dependent protein kinase 2 [Seminavis robusta]|eukprot:Sro68_g038070.1 Calcium-dependent protein kinase 2 (108) ;mRNA; f:53328-53651
MKNHVRNDKYLRAEIFTMSRLCHPNTVNTVEAFERKRHIYLFLEFCWGGNLCERNPTEPEAAAIVRKSLSAVAYMHRLLLSGEQPFVGPPKEMSWEKRKKFMIDRII